MYESWPTFEASEGAEAVTQTASETALAVVQAYHQRSKHALQAYAAGPDTLDWDAQPDPWRRFAGAPLQALPLRGQGPDTPWADLFEPGRVPSLALSADSLGLLLELSLALAAWKEAGPDRWAVRINPSSGNLHPTEAWLLTQCVPGLADGLYHYAPLEHGLELRASVAAAPAAPRCAWIALSSIHWREAWKYGERAWRYALLDLGHAVGALRYAAALCGWRLLPLPIRTADLARLLGLDRSADYGLAERDDPDLLLALQPAGVAGAQADEPAAAAGEVAFLLAWLQRARWHGQANRLDPHPMYRWPVIAEAAASSAVASTRRPPAAAAAPLPSLSPLLRSRQPAAALIRQRRSAQRFDARARMPLASLWPLLQALHPGRLPFDALPGAPRVHLLLLAHRVDGLAPGAYLLPRSAAGWTLLQSNLPVAADAPLAPGAPSDAPLRCLARNPALAGTLRTLNCHQALGSDAILGFALLAEFNPMAQASDYRDRLHEAGLIGQALYLEAESLGLSGTGIGCFFDDALHQLIGLAPSAAGQAVLQSVYHFTIGLALHDSRISSSPPYAHRPAASGASDV